MGMHRSPISLYFPQLFFIEVTFFPTGFYSLMCHGIYLEVIRTMFTQVRTLSTRGPQIDSDIEVTHFLKIIKHAAVFLVYSWRQP